MGLWAVSFFFSCMHTISRVWFKWKFYDYCYYYFQSFHRVDCSSPDSSLYVDFLPLYIILSPISLYIWSHMAVIQKKTLSSILFFFFSSLLSTPFVHKKTLWMELLFFVFYHFFFPSFLTLYKVETLLLQQKKNTLFSTIRVLSSWPHPLHLCHFSLFLKQKM